MSIPSGRLAFLGFRYFKLKFISFSFNFNNIWVFFMSFSNLIYSFCNPVISFTCNPVISFTVPKLGFFVFPICCGIVPDVVFHNVIDVELIKHFNEKFLIP